VTQSHKRSTPSYFLSLAGVHLKHIQYFTILGTYSDVQMVLTTHDSGSTWTAPPHIKYYLTYCPSATSSSISKPVTNPDLICKKALHTFPYPLHCHLRPLFCSPPSSFSTFAFYLAASTFSFLIASLWKSLACASIIALCHTSCSVRNASFSAPKVLSAACCWNISFRAY
jgi:hypothetical protein